MVIAQTERLLLRRWLPSDRAPFASLNADARVMEHFPSVLSREESDRGVDRIEAHFEQHGFGLCAAQLRETGAFIGFIGLAVPPFEAHFTPCVEIGWRLAAEYWGRGLATEGARETVRYAFHVVGLDNLVSMTVPLNTRSRRVMEKLGMTRNPSDDFDHPKLSAGHPLRRHVLYRLSRAVCSSSGYTSAEMSSHAQEVGESRRTAGIGFVWQSRTTPGYRQAVLRRRR